MTKEEELQKIAKVEDFVSFWMKDADVMERMSIIINSKDSMGKETNSMICLFSAVVEVLRKRQQANCVLLEAAHDAIKMLEDVTSVVSGESAPPLSAE